MGIMKFHFLKIVLYHIVFQIPRYFKSITDLNVIMITKFEEVQVQMIWNEPSNVLKVVYGMTHQFVSVSTNFTIATIFLTKMIGITFKFSSDGG